MEPEILVLDEPTTFLDPPGQRALAQLLAALPQAKVIITHDIPFARAVCTRAAFFEGGQIVDEDSVDQVARRRDWDFTPLRTA